MKLSIRYVPTPRIWVDLVLIELMKDVGRTFPSNPQFFEDGRLFKPLRNILQAFSWYRPDIGYCQGMDLGRPCVVPFRERVHDVIFFTGLNFMAGSLLLVCGEEEAFWLLTAIVEDILPQEYYSGVMAGAHVDELVFGELLKEKIPDVAAHLKSMGCDIRVLIAHWFICCFANCMPWQVLFRVWDVMFNEGSKIIFRVGLSLFLLNRDKFLGTRDLGEVFAVTKKITLVSDRIDELMRVRYFFLLIHTLSSSFCFWWIF